MKISGELQFADALRRIVAEEENLLQFMIIVALIYGIRTGHA